MQTLGISCPVCGKYVFEAENDYDTCHVCGWENDELQRKDADYTGGANYISLNEARILFELKKNDNTKKKATEILEKYKALRIGILRKYNEMRANELNKLHDEFNKELNQINKEI